MKRAASWVDSGKNAAITIAFVVVAVPLFYVAGFVEHGQRKVLGAFRSVFGREVHRGR